MLVIYHCDTSSHIPMLMSSLHKSKQISTYLSSSTATSRYILHIPQDLYGSHEAINLAVKIIW